MGDYKQKIYIFETKKCSILCFSIGMCLILLTIVKMGKFGTKMSIILLTEEKEKIRFFIWLGHDDRGNEVSL